jgi:hypothetical protein
MVPHLNTPGPNVIKLFTAIINNKLESQAFPSKSNAFGKARTYPNEVPFRLYTLG